MSKAQTLRALVNERLAAAAEEIFVLFERTIAEYEEELCRCKKENQRKQKLLDQVLNQIPPTSPGPGLNQEIPESPWIKEELKEQDDKQNELPSVPVPESSGVCVKTEESSLLQQTQTWHREETEGEDISSETEGLSPYTDDGDSCEPSFTFSAAQMDIEADEDEYNQDQIRDGTELFHQTMSAPETVHRRHMSGADEAEKKSFQCSFCNKSLRTKQSLQRHIRIHTGERPYSCSICEKTFAQKSHLAQHERTHTGEKPFSCLICNKHFAHSWDLNSHKRTHTGERPYSCSICNKTFAKKCHLNAHMVTHSV